MVILGNTGNLLNMSLILVKVHMTVQTIELTSPLAADRGSIGGCQIIMRKAWPWTTVGKNVYGECHAPCTHIKYLFCRLKKNIRPYLAFRFSLTFAFCWTCSRSDYVWNICYLDLKQQTITILTSSIHWTCYCAVHINVVFRFMW